MNKILAILITLAAAISSPFALADQSIPQQCPSVSAVQTTALIQLSPLQDNKSLFVENIDYFGTPYIWVFGIAVESTDIKTALSDARKLQSTITKIAGPPTYYSEDQYWVCYYLNGINKLIGLAFYFPDLASAN